MQVAVVAREELGFSTAGSSRMLVVPSACSVQSLRTPDMNQPLNASTALSKPILESCARGSSDFTHPVDPRTATEKHHDRRMRDDRVRSASR